MSVNQSNSYDRFEKANAPKRVTGIDYVRSIYKSLNLPSDFVLQFSQLFWPNFLVVDGKVFVNDLFDRERYEGLRKSGQSESGAQFWMNLLEITALFDDLLEPQALAVAEIAAACWNRKLDGEFSGNADEARVVHDKATGEVFVVLGKPD